MPNEPYILQDKTIIVQAPGERKWQKIGPRTWKVVVAQWHITAYIPIIECLNPTPDTRKEKMGENLGTIPESDPDSFLFSIMLVHF